MPDRTFAVAAAREFWVWRTIELPALAGSQRYFDAQLAGAVAKGKRPRTFYIAAGPLRDIEAYLATTRRAVIRRAQAVGRYDELDEIWLVTKLAGRARRELTGVIVAAGPGRAA